MVVKRFGRRVAGSVSSGLVAAGVVLGMAAFNPASAGFIQTNDADFGAGQDGFNITQDDETGLDWLDVTLSINLSFDFVSTQFGVGGDFEGWRYATTSEVIGFFDNAGVRDALLGTTGVETLNPKATFDPLVMAFLDLTGRTLTRSVSAHNASLFDDGNFADGFVGRAYVLEWFGTSEGNSPDSDIRLNGQSASQGFSSTGSFLVRDTDNMQNTDIPEPGTLAIFGLGLLGLGMTRRRRRAG